MQYALALSLVLHCGAALIVILVTGFSTGKKSSTNFIIQDITLTQSISAPPKTVVAPLVPPSEMALPTTTPSLEPEKPASIPALETPSTASGGIGKEGGLMSTPLGLGIKHGYFSGLADGKTLRDDIRGYYFEMVEKINREWWDKAELLKEPLRRDGIFEVQVKRDGTLVSIRILQGTGSSEADRLVTEIIRIASPLPSLPSSYDLDMFRAPLRIKAPSFLFRTEKNTMLL